MDLSVAFLSIYGFCAPRGLRPWQLQSLRRRHTLPRGQAEPTETSDLDIYDENEKRWLGDAFGKKHGIQAPRARNGAAQPGASNPTELEHLSYKVVEHAMASLRVAVVALAEGQEGRALDFRPPSEASNFISADMLLMLCCCVVVCCGCAVWSWAWSGWWSVCVSLRVCLVPLSFVSLLSFFFR